ncbi:MAG: SulP family inorganic anion transporter [Alphaproteobacteria bacterium]|nr:SulP family inorganic anion transporter [Alphaproteobacteria bacterium]
MLRPTLAAFAERFSVNIRQRGELPPLTPNQIRIEVLAGLTVALALVPEAVAFAFVAGVPPLVGLYAAFIVGLITALFGGRRGMISGATGALAVVMVGLVVNHGIEYLFATVVLMGIIQIAAGILRLGKFIRMVPHPVMLGFVNGLAIVIGLAQLSLFQEQSGSAAIATTSVEASHAGHGGHGIAGGEWLPMPELSLMIALTLLTMAVIWLVPKFTKAVPAPLAGILVTAGIVIGLGQMGVTLNVQTVGDLASIEGGLPQFHIPLVPLNLETLYIIVPYAFILAAIGLIESLLTLNLVGEITGRKGGASQECLAQGAANLVTGFFGGMGGCAMIGQSMINVKSGARLRLSGVMASLFLLAFILVGSSLIEQIPLAALVGVMFMVVIGTFAWQSFVIMRRIPKSDAFVIILVTAVTVMHDLAIAVVVGVIVSALVYAWKAASHIHAREEEDESGRKIYRIDGPLFFGSITGFMDLFDIAGDPDRVVIDFADSRVVDQSALQAVEDLAAKYDKAGKQVELRHLSRDCHRLLSKAGQLMVDSDDDPAYELAVDYRVRLGRMGSGH